MKRFYHKIVIGSSLEAIFYAFFNNYKILYTRSLQPEDYEAIEDFGLGNNKKLIWDKHIFQLSLSGYIPFENKIKHIRYEDATTLKVVTKEENVYTINFDNLYIFDDYNFLDLPSLKASTSKEYRIVDEFTYKSKFIDMENIQQDSNYINQIMFDESKKNIKVISYISKSDIDNFAEHLVKIKTENIINIPKLELDHSTRKIFDLGQNIYDDFDNVCFVYSDLKLLYEFHKKRKKIDYMKYLRLKMSL